MRIALGTAGSGDFHQTGFEYQSEGRPVIDEYEEETWTYNDTISSSDLLFYDSLILFSVCICNVQLTGSCGPQIRKQYFITV